MRFGFCCENKVDQIWCIIHNKIREHCWFDGMGKERNMLDETDGGTKHMHEKFLHQIEDGMPNQETLCALADFYKVFGDVTRIKILCALFQTESCVCGLAEGIGMTQSAVSHQLRVLKQMKLVKNRREGKTIYYSLADSHIQTILNQGMEHIAE